MNRVTADTLTDEQIRAYGDRANANGDALELLRAHRALAVPPVSWEAAWTARAEARRFIASCINLADDAQDVDCAEVMYEITDEQILRLYAETTADYPQMRTPSHAGDCLARECLVALGMGGFVYPAPQTRAARVICAEILSARMKEAALKARKNVSS